MKRFLSKKKLIRFLSCFSVLILIIPCFFINSFALNSVDPSINFDGFEVIQIQVNLYDYSGTRIPIDVSCTADSFVQNDGTRRLTLSIRRSDGGVFNLEHYDATIIMQLKDDFYLNSSYYVDCSYDFITYRSQVEGIGDLDSGYFYGYRFTSDARNNFANVLSFRNDGGYSYYHFGYTSGEIGVPYYNYLSNFFFRFTSSNVSTFYIFLDNVSFDIVTPEERASKDIQSNFDENTNKIISHQDSNTNKIINGGSDSPHYSSFDDSITSEYEYLEQGINFDTEGSRSSTVSFFNNFGALLNDTNVSRGLLAVSKIYNQFFSIGWVSGLVQFSLALGSFSFLLGAVMIVVGRVSGSSDRASERKERHAARREQLKYYRSRNRG